MSTTTGKGNPLSMSREEMERRAQQVVSAGPRGLRWIATHEKDSLFAEDPEGSTLIMRIATTCSDRMHRAILKDPELYLYRNRNGRLVLQAMYDVASKSIREYIRSDPAWAGLVHDRDTDVRRIVRLD